MIPKRKEWEQWTTTKKVAFLGLPVAGVGTLIAFFTLLAASESNRQQRELFSASDQPILQLTNIEFASMQDASADHVRFTIKNTGQSQAYGICVGIYQVTKNGKVLFSDNALIETCVDDYPIPRFDLIQGLENSSILVPAKELGSRLGYKPSKAQIITGQPSSDPYLFNLYWKDVAENEHSNMYMLQFSR